MVVRMPSVRSCWRLWLQEFEVANYFGLPGRTQSSPQPHARDLELCSLSPNVSQLGVLSK